MYFSGNKDTDTLILLYVDDNDLKNISLLNSKLYKICNDENFWKMRIINKTDKSVDLLIEILKNKNSKFLNQIHKIKNFPEIIEKVKKYYGFANMKELNMFLNKFPLQSIINIYTLIKIDSDVVNEIIDFFYEFDEELLPKYIDLQKILYYLR